MGVLAWKMAKGGFLKSQSVGFIPLEWTNGAGKDAPDRTYTKCELLEISLVVVPANPGATIGLALKSGAIDRNDLLTAAKFLAGMCGSHFSNDESDSPGKQGAGAGDVNAARWLEIAKLTNIKI